MINHPNCQEALALLQSKGDGQLNYSAEKIFMKSSWVCFDPLRAKGDWITDEIQWLLM
ncbi:hypothetical protein NRIC_19470 [Enterococcus florum]|uniref:Uncharacterized protein n=2 Tax=Enterococcus florum TaxID=2480627 RepID=A0A4P5P930_9ENTE|nr:hypothetical protein NRIC_19470 [Enterococcus florum]